MSDFDTDDWKEFKEQKRLRREKRLDETPTQGWSYHTQYHWFRFVKDKKLDYWPSTGKWQYDGKVYHYGDVLLFIEETEKGKPSLDRITYEEKYYDTQPFNIPNTNTNSSMEPAISDTTICEDESPPWED